MKELSCESLKSIFAASTVMYIIGPNKTTPFSYMLFGRHETPTFCVACKDTF